MTVQSTFIWANYLLPNSPYCMIYLWWETERENWSWSLLEVKGLRVHTYIIQFSFILFFWNCGFEHFHMFIQNTCNSSRKALTPQKLQQPETFRFLFYLPPWLHLLQCTLYIGAHLEGIGCFHWQTLGSKHCLWNRKIQFLNSFHVSGCG